MKKTIGKMGVVMLLLLGLFVGLVPQRAYADIPNAAKSFLSIYGTPHVLPDPPDEYTWARDGDFAIYLKYDQYDSELFSLIWNARNKTTLTINGQKFDYYSLPGSLAGYGVRGKYYTNPDLVYAFDRSTGQKIHIIPIFLNPKDAPDGAKIKMEIAGRGELNFVVHRNGDKVTAEFDPDMPDPNLPAYNDALKQLQKYVDGVEKDVLSQLQAHANTDAVKAYAEQLKKAEQFLAEGANRMTEERYREIQKLLGYRGARWYPDRGEFTKLAKKIVVPFEVLGDRTKEDVHTQLTHTTTLSKDGTIKIKTPIEGLSKDQAAKHRLYLEAITADEYKKDPYDEDAGYATAPFDDSKYKVAGGNGEYTINVSFVTPEIEILKPIMKVKIDAYTYATGSDLVFVENRDKFDALQELKKYMAEAHPEFIEELSNNPNAQHVEDYKRDLEFGKQMLQKEANPDTLTDDELHRLQALLGHNPADGSFSWEDGEFTVSAKKIELKFQVVGTRDQVDKNDSSKKYPTIPSKNGTITIEGGISGLSTSANTRGRLYLQSISKSDYDGDRRDPNSNEYPASNFSGHTLNETANGYTMTVPNVSKGIALLKPMMEVKIAPKVTQTYSDLVFVKQETPPTPPPTPGPGPGGGALPPIPFVPGGTTGSGRRSTSVRIIEERGEKYGYAIAPAGTVDSSLRLRVTDKPNGKQDVILVDHNGNEVFSDVLMLATIPAPKGQQGPYRVKVNGVYTTFELTEDGQYVTLPMVFSRDGKAREDAVLREGDVVVRGTQEALANAYGISVVDRGNLRYSVNLIDKNGNKVHSNGPVMVTMPSPAGAGEVYRVKADGKWITFEVENKIVRFALIF